MSLAADTRLGPYEILGLIGTLRLRSGQAGGSAFARGPLTTHERRRGLAEAKPRSRT
jgi:hypothetical protein